MSNRVVTASIAALCGIGLVIAGIGWRSEEPPQPKPVERVYCNIDALVRYHPAWNQFAQLNGLPPQGVSAGDSVRTGDDAAVPPVSVASSAGRVDFDRSRFRAKLEERSEQELARIREGLYDSLESRVTDRRRELVARAEAEQADQQRIAEQALAANLRALDESRQYERVDAAIKLSALKAQIGIPEAGSERVKTAIKAREKALADVRAKLAQDEEALRRKSAGDLEAAHGERLAQIREDLDLLRTQESKRIGDRLNEAGSKIRRDLEGDTVRGLDVGSRPRAWAVRVSVGSGPAEKLAAGAESDYTSAVRSTKVSGAASGLRDRMATEIRAEVKRIAREYGVEVTFGPAAGVKDSTKWFKERLPYVRAGKAG